MTEFETIFITQSDLDEAAVKALGDKMRAIIAKDGAIDGVKAVEKTAPKGGHKGPAVKDEGSHLLAYRDWGVRKLAYEIKKTRRGRYFYLNYAGDTRLVPEVERNLRYDEKVLRFMTVQ